MTDPHFCCYWLDSLETEVQQRFAFGAGLEHPKSQHITEQEEGQQQRQGMPRSSARAEDHQASPTIEDVRAAAIPTSDRAVRARAIKAKKHVQRK
jgi:hypothetical protein